MEMSCDGNDELEHGDVCIEGGDVEQHRLYRSLAMLRQQLNQTAETSKASAITQCDYRTGETIRQRRSLKHQDYGKQRFSILGTPVLCRMPHSEPQILRHQGIGRNEMPCFSKVVYLQAQPGCTPALDSVSGPWA